MTQLIVYGTMFKGTAASGTSANETVVLCGIPNNLSPSVSGVKHDLLRRVIHGPAGVYRLFIKSHLDRWRD